MKSSRHLRVNALNRATRHGDAAFRITREKIVIVRDMTFSFPSSPSPRESLRRRRTSSAGVTFDQLAEDPL